MISIDKILRKIRETEGVSQKKVYFGLCSKSMYSTYEDGTNIPSWLLLRALLQRMGKSTEKLSIILTAEEYQYLCWREKVLEAAERGDDTAVLQLLEHTTAQKPVIHKNLQSQFYLLMQAMMMRKTKEARAQKERYLQLLKQAVELTMPGICPQNMEQYLIGESEMQILLELAEGLIFVGEEEEAYAFLKAMLQHIERHYEDYELKVKVYPKAVRLILPLMRKNHEQIEAMVLCKKAIELLCWLGVLYDLQELLDVYLELCKATAQEEEYAQFQKYAWALHEVCRTFGEGREQSEGTMLSYQNQELYLVNEVIRSGRICRKLTQDQLSEAISCTPETMSRIESGKRSPSTKNFRALLNETKTDLDYFNSELVTEDFEVLEKTQELDQAIFLYDWKEAERLLDVIKEKLNSDYPQNEGFIKLKECCIRYNQGEIGAEEFLTACEE